MKKFSVFLDRAGTIITSRVGTMWAAILFAVLALVSLPGAIMTQDPVVIVAWIAQTFLQLVLLPIIMVGQRLQGEKTEKRDQETHDEVMSSHAELQALLAALNTSHEKLNDQLLKK